MSDEKVTSRRGGGRSEKEGLEAHKFCPPPSKAALLWGCRDFDDQPLGIALGIYERGERRGARDVGLRPSRSLSSRGRVSLVRCELARSDKCTRSAPIHHQGPTDSLPPPRHVTLDIGLSFDGGLGVTKHDLHVSPSRLGRRRPIKSRTVVRRESYWVSHFVQGMIHHSRNLRFWSLE